VVLGVLFLSLIVALVLRLWFLQVLTAQASTRQAVANIERPLPDPAARGKIFDRNGAVLATNVPSEVVSLDRTQFEVPAPTKTDKNAMALTPQGQQVLSRLSAVLHTPVPTLLAALNNLNVASYNDIPVAKNVSQDAVVYIEENQARGVNLFPGVTVEQVPLRNYPNQAVAGNTLGYVGQIGPHELNTPAYRGDAANSQIGRTGLEQQYEKVLHGTDGVIEQAVNAQGQVQGVPLSVKSPVPGDSLVTTLDLKIQDLVEQSLAAGLSAARTEHDPVHGTRYPAPAGSVVVMDPNNGQILAMASNPSYDPNQFIGGISTANYNALKNNPAHPLTNRVIDGQYPPGSTFKVVSAAAALGTGVASPYGMYPCTSSVTLYKQLFKNFETTNGSSISIAQAITQSCDTVFYNYGDSFYQTFYNHGTQAGPEVLQSYARQFGLGSPTGIDLPGEASGLVPDNKWLQTVHKKYPTDYPYDIWLPGYTIQMAIGQGDLLMTPLQMASIYSSVANGGTIYQPELGMQIKDGTQVVQQIQPKVTGHLPVSPTNLATIKQGLLGVVANQSGTANLAFAGFPLGQIPVAGKTGTADVGPLTASGAPVEEPDAWFASYAPANNPQYVVIVQLENGGFGAQTAAPIAKRIYQGLFNLPLTNIGQGAQTFG
jgi:penicillin-binding protein 2